MTKHRMNVSITQAQVDYLRARSADEGRTMPNMLLRIIDLELAARASKEKAPAAEAASVPKDLQRTARLRRGPRQARRRR
jgi:hypothetical protein